MKSLGHEQALLGNLLGILARGRDSAGVYGCLEGFLLLGGTAILEGHMPALVAALSCTLNALMAAIMPARNGSMDDSAPGLPAEAGMAESSGFKCSRGLQHWV